MNVRQARGNGVDIQLFVTVNMMMLSLTAIAVTLIFRPQGGETWIVANAVLVLIGSAALFFFPKWSATILICAAVPLVLGPAILSTVAQRRATQNRMKDAAFYARLAAFLHPVQRNHFDTELTRALAITDTEASIAALSALAERAPPERQDIVRTWICRTRDDWEGALECSQKLSGVPSVASLRVRAFGEVGQYDEMTRAYEEAKAVLSGLQLHHTQLFVMAFCGREAGVRFIFQHQLAMMPDDTKAYWLAVASLASGQNSDEASRLFTEIGDTAAEMRVRMAARRRLAQTPGDTPVILSPKAADVAADVEIRLRRDVKRYAAGFREIPATLSLLAIIMGMFFIETITGGMEDLPTLVGLGALWPPLVLNNGEWWRVGTALFLHFGALHLFVNSLSLLLVGRIVENLLGSVRLLVAFLLGGAVSSLVVLAGMWLGLTQYAVLVGASGAIFAILGLETARQVLNWLRSRDVLDRRELMTLIIIVLIQFSIDLSIPEISFTAHASGFVAGAVIGLLMALANGGRLEPRGTSDAAV